jgi:DNA-binding NarL/FixJ family response regulator
MNMNKIILADSNVAFRKAVASVLSADEEMQIVAQCDDLDQLYRSIAEWPGAIVLVATGLDPDFMRLRILLDSMGSRGILVAEPYDSPWPYIEQDFKAVMFRNSTGRSFLECVRQVAGGAIWMPVLAMFSAGNSAHVPDEFSEYDEVQLPTMFFRYPLHGADDLPTIRYSWPESSGKPREI